MPNIPASDEHPTGGFVAAWKRFVAALRAVLSATPEERSLDAFIPLRDSALEAAESPQMLLDLERAWSKLHGGAPANESPTSEVAHLLLLEFSSFPASVELSAAEEKAGKPPSPLRKRLLGLAKTVLGSARDILELSPLAKGTLKVLGEVADIFQGKD